MFAPLVVKWKLNPSELIRNCRQVAAAIAVVKIDCSELTQDVQLALASSISEETQGKSLALVSGEDIVIDTISGPMMDSARLTRLVEKFISRRKEAEHYQVETQGDAIVVRSPDPVAARRTRTLFRVPPGAYQCPACGLILPDEGKYQTHLRTHDLIRGIR